MIAESFEGGKVREVKDAKKVNVVLTSCLPLWRGAMKLYSLLFHYQHASVVREAREAIEAMEVQ